MNNKDKQYLSGLEKRVVRLEGVIDSLTRGIQEGNKAAYYCSQCSCYDPLVNGYVCSQVDCCQGLNPYDDGP